MSGVPHPQSPAFRPHRKVIDLRPDARRRSCQGDRQPARAQSHIGEGDRRVAILRVVDTGGLPRDLAKQAPAEEEVVRRDLADEAALIAPGKPGCFGVSLGCPFGQMQANLDPVHRAVVATGKSCLELGRCPARAKDQIDGVWCAAASCRVDEGLAFAEVYAERLLAQDRPALYQGPLRIDPVRQRRAREIHDVHIG